MCFISYKSCVAIFPQLGSDSYVKIVATTAAPSTTTAAGVGAGAAASGRSGSGRSNSGTVNGNGVVGRASTAGKTDSGGNSVPLALALVALLIVTAGFAALRFGLRRQARTASMRQNIAAVHAEEELTAGSEGGRRPRRQQWGTGSAEPDTQLTPLQRARVQYELAQERWDTDVGTTPSESTKNPTLREPLPPADDPPPEIVRAAARRRAHGPDGAIDFLT